MKQIINNVTGALSQEDKAKYMKYINRLYKDKYIDAVHMTPIDDKVKIEVVFTAQKTHMVKKLADDSFEECEYPLAGNDR